MFYVYLTIGIVLLIGVSIAGGASKQFVDTVKKRDNILSSISLTASDFAKNVIMSKNLPITVVRTSGEYTDYYSSRAKQIALSEGLYLSPTVVALGVTAHELGHAITDIEKNALYKFHKYFRRLISFLNKVVYLALIAALVLLIGFEEYFNIGIILLYVVLGIFVLSIIFKIVTVGNENKASQIGIELLKSYGMPKDEIKIVKKVYHAALLTYIGEIFMPVVKFFGFIGKLFDLTIGKLFK